MNLNKVFVLGNVTRDPEVRAMPSGQQVCNFGIATNRFYTDQAGVKKQDAEFHNIVCFGKLADIAQRFLTKGGLVLIEGRIKTSSWDDKATGTKKFRTEIIAESLQLGPRPAGMGAAPMGQYQKSAQSTPASAQSYGEAKEDIPVIEENAPVNFNIEDSKSFTQEERSDEIDVKDIPF